MKPLKFIIPAAFVFLFAFTAHAQSTGAQEVIKTLLEQVLRIQTQLVAQVDYSTSPDFVVVDITRSPSGIITPEWVIT